MDLKIIYAIIACLTLAISGVFAQASQKQIKLRGQLSTRKGGVLKQFTNDATNGLVICTFNESTQTVELEFVDDVDNDLTIEVWGNDGICIFSEATPIVNGLHIIVDYSVSTAWAFEVFIFDYTTGTYVSGGFELP